MKTLGIIALTVAAMFLFRLWKIQNYPYSSPTPVAMTQDESYQAYRKAHIFDQPEGSHEDVKIEGCANGGCKVGTNETVPVVIVHEEREQRNGIWVTTGSIRRRISFSMVLVYTDGNFYPLTTQVYNSDNQIIGTRSTVSPGAYVMDREGNVPYTVEEWVGLFPPDEYRIVPKGAGDEIVDRYKYLTSGQQQFLQTYFCQKGVPIFDHKVFDPPSGIVMVNGRSTLTHPGGDYDVTKMVNVCNH